MSKAIQFLTEWEQLPGKTIERVINDDRGYLVFVFTDGTAAMPFAQFGYEGDREAYTLEDGEYIGNYELVRLGFMEQTEYDRIERERKQRENQAARESERALYEQLKQKYGQ